MGCELYGLEVSPDLISTVTDAVLETVAEWRNRPLETSYPLVFFDAIRVKIRAEGLVREAETCDHANSLLNCAGCRFAKSSRAGTLLPDEIRHELLLLKFAFGSQDRDLLLQQGVLRVRELCAARASRSAISISARAWAN